MALKKQRIPYEVLVRFDEKGQYKGAHVAYISQVVENGQVLVSNTELAEVNDENFPLLDVMNEVQASAIRRVEVLDTELNNLNSELSKKTKEVEDISKELNIRDNSLKTANDEIEQLRSELQEAHSKLVEAQRVNQELINNIKVNESNQTKEVDS